MGSLLDRLPLIRQPVLVEDGKLGVDSGPVLPRVYSKDVYTSHISSRASACWFGNPPGTDSGRPAQPCACVKHGGANQVLPVVLKIVLYPQMLLY